MRILDEFGNDIDGSEVDLSAGYICNTQVVKKDASPIDNVEKFAWAEDDWEDAQVFIRFSSRMQIEKAKSRLRDTDYIVVKTIESLLKCKSITDMIAVFANTIEEYGDVVDERISLRSKVNELESKE